MSPKKIFVCVCEKEFKSKQKITEHIRSIHGGDRFLCTICMDFKSGGSGGWFNSKSSLLRHYNRKNHTIPNLTAINGIAFIINKNIDKNDERLFYSS